MKCPNVACGDKVEEHVNSVGGGSRYCLGGCGYFEELPPGSMPRPRARRPEPPQPIGPKKPRRR